MNDPEHPKTLCSARRKSGTPCGNSPMLGTNVCRMHGGAAPQVKRAAAIRLLMAADSVAGELVRIATSKTASDSVKVQAIFGILDRAGLNPRQAVDVDVAVGIKQSPEDRYSDVIESILEPIDRAHWSEGIDGPWPYGNFDSYGEWIAAGAPGLPPSRRAALDANVIDAEIVDDVHESSLDTRIEATERERDKRRRRGLDPELPPAVERRLDKDASRKALTSIEDDPRSLLSVASRDDLNRKREAFLIERLDLDPRKKRRRRRT